ncbi:MAG: hypothetical protein LBK52_05935, partial [Deltaproteobacteria bacterium]|nr:hypothetical protein [Deltaproteobacteria bacterium]
SYQASAGVQPAAQPSYQPAPQPAAQPPEAWPGPASISQGLPPEPELVNLEPESRDHYQPQSVRPPETIELKLLGPGEPGGRQPRGPRQEDDFLDGPLSLDLEEEPFTGPEANDDYFLKLLEADNEDPSNRRR